MSRCDTENKPKSAPTLKDTDANTQLNLGLADFWEDEATKKHQAQRRPHKNGSVLIYGASSVPPTKTFSRGKNKIITQISEPFDSTEEEVPSLPGPSLMILGTSPLYRAKYLHTSQTHGRERPSVTAKYIWQMFPLDGAERTSRNSRENIVPWDLREFGFAFACLCLFAVNSGCYIFLFDYW